jgi:putative hydrolase of the HAD superfamily
VPGFSEQAWSLFLGGFRGTTIDRALEAMGVSPSPDLVAQAVQRYRQHTPRIELLADARALLDAAASAAIPVAVVSDGPSASQAAKARALGLDRWASPIVLTADLAPGSAKPSPAAFILVEEQRGVAGPACTYVADNPAKDFVAPHSREWTTVRIRRPASLHAAVDSGADVQHEFADLAGLAAELGLRLPAPH